MIISVWGKEKRMEEVRRLLRQDHTCVSLDDLSCFDLRLIDALILPLQSIQGEKGEYMDRSQIHLPQYFWECLREDCKIIAGKETSFLRQLPYQKFYYMKDEAFLCKNARLTAQGTLFYILDQADRALDEYSADIIGKGRCGKAIGTLLTALGMKVRYVRHRIATSEDECCYDEWKLKQCADFIIFCAPCAMLDKETILHFSKGTHFIDISGVERKWKDLLVAGGNSYVYAAALPEVFASRSSGKAIYTFAKEVLYE